MFSNSLAQILVSMMGIILLSACSNEVTPKKAIYIWESDRQTITESEQGFLNKHKIEKLYIKFFEVEKNETLGIYPTAKSAVKLPKDLAHYEIVPTVYIRNEVFKKYSKEELTEFADNMIFLIEKRFKAFCGNAKNTFQEIQMDCDWTISTQENYFYFLRKLKEKTSVQISATLRLYPYKFPDKMGVLPVDRAMLMCYNLLSPLNAGKRNSILDLNELEKYLNGANEYPLPLDLALPIYSSALLFQHDHFVGMHYLTDQKFKESLRHKKGGLYHVKKDTVVGRTYLRQGDQVKLEMVNNQLIKNALKIINRNVCFEDGASLSLFHLTSSQLKTFSDEEITSIYSPLFH